MNCNVFSQIILLNQKNSKTGQFYSSLVNLSAWMTEKLKKTTECKVIIFIGKHIQKMISAKM